MVARSKKKGSPSLKGQETENTTKEDLVMTAEAAQDSFISIDNESLAASQENLPAGFNFSEHLEAVTSEVNMNTSTELMEAHASEMAEADAVAEPVIDLESSLSIQNVVKLYDKLKKSYAAYDAIEIDASQVKSIDTASLQLFVALKKDAKKHNKEVAFFQPSDRFIESARLLDLLEILEIEYV